ncbi:MAG TPA: hypothetical protein VF783_00350 [Terriglobales bacterium]
MDKQDWFTREKAAEVSLIDQIEGECQSPEQALALEEIENLASPTVAAYLLSAKRFKLNELGLGLACADLIRIIHYWGAINGCFKHKRATN